MVFQGVGERPFRTYHAPHLGGPRLCRETPPMAVTLRASIRIAINGKGIRTPEKLV
jgi:hypothetical protein